MKLKRFTTQLVAAGLITVPLMVHAAGLGKMSVNSALGQPLAAEIELFAADKAELESLSASLASDQAFRDANVEFAPVLSSLRFSVEKKPNGKSVLKVTSSRPVNDPFVDMLIELNWASGRLVREYTMLLDPPGMAPQQSVAPVVVTPAKPPVTRRAPPPVADQAPAAAKPSAPVAAPVPAAEPAPQPVVASAAPDQVRVKRGDTLSGIARQMRPAGVSLEQALVGLYRENPQAFDGNMNRMKAGVTLAVPSVEKAASIPQREAVREIKLQSDDWRAYRQSLAGKVQEAPAAEPAPSQASSGKLTPKVEDRAKPAPEAQKDVLKLSKVTPPATAAAAKLDEKRAAQEKLDKLRALEEDAIARQKAMKESEQRAAMLEKQIQDAQKLIEMKEKANAGAASEPAVVAAAPVVPVPAPVPAPVVQKPAPVAAVEAPVAPTENWFTPLLANPMYWGGALVALGLGGALWWMMAGG
ncbi:MAG: hypothetical protein KKG40_03100, partial [Gammaproteobacteria bacterium]|nr:hypothetical protein [Gammaproteobacteria bacterium]